MAHPLKPQVNRYNRPYKLSSPDDDCSHRYPGLTGSEPAMTQFATPVDASERWLPVVGWEGLYEISDCGRVRSLPRRTVSGVRGGQMLKLTAGKKGYWRVTIWRNNKATNCGVHRLVTMAFIGPIPPGMEVLHGPAGSWDNHVSNLSIGTHRQNIHDKFRDGTLARGERHGMTRLSEADVLELRRRYAAGESARELARAFGLNSTGVAKIISGATWGHVPGAVPMRASRGEVLSHAKLTAVVIPAIRARVAAGELQTVLALEFGVSPSAIYGVISGRSWKHVA